MQIKVGNYIQFYTKFLMRFARPRPPRGKAAEGERNIFCEAKNKLYIVNYLLEVKFALYKFVYNCHSKIYIFIDFKY